MTFKHLYSIAFFLFFLILKAQEQPSISAPFLLEGPDNWRKEVLNLPLGFAPQLKYEGIEFVRFAEGWGNRNSEEFWTYKFAWYLDEKPHINSDQLNEELKLYFDGLLNIVGKGKGISKNSIVPTKTNINSDGELSFKGTVIIFDVFFLEALQTLNIKVTPTYCDTLKKHIVYFEFSPQNYNHPLWDTMKQIKITCK